MNVLETDACVNEAMKAARNAVYIMLGSRVVVTLYSNELMNISVLRAYISE